MAKIDPTAKPAPVGPLNTDPRDEALRALEEANASLAERVTELEGELAQAKRDAEGAQYRVHEVEGKLTAVEAQRDAFQKERDSAAERVEQLSREASHLNAALDRRAPPGSPDVELRRTRRALEISALVSLHVEKVALGLTDERAVSAALRLGDELVAEVEASPGSLG